jgi:hypothetical protein
MWVNFHICLLCSDDETTAELSFLWSGVRSQFLLFTALLIPQCVCVCAIKKLNRNRRHYFFSSSNREREYSFTVVGHAMSKKKK